MDKLRAAVIGVGYLGNFHAQKYALLPDVELVAVADTDSARGAEIAHLANGEHGAQELRAVSGSVLDGRTTNPGSDEGYLGRYASQVTFVENATERELLTFGFEVEAPERPSK